MTKRRLFQTTVLASALLLGAGMTFVAGTAIAGFEWKGPVTPPPANYENDPANSANPENFPAPIDMNSATVPMMPAERVQHVDVTPVAPPMAVTGQTAEVPSSPSIINPAPVIDTVAPAPVYAATPAITNGGDVISGFGSDLPLAIALQQIAPPGYQYSFGPGVDAGTIVSWQGGKSWQQVLSDSLVPAGLGYTLGDNTITIVSGVSAPALPEHVLPPVTFVDSAPVPLTSASTMPVASELTMPASSEPPRPDVAGIDFDAPVNNAMSTRTVDPQAPVTIRRQKPSAMQRPNRAERTIAQNDAAEGPRNIFPRGPYGIVSRRTARAAEAPVVMSQPPVLQETLPEAVTPVAADSADDMTPINIAPAAQQDTLMPQDIAEPVQNPAQNNITEPVYEPAPQDMAEPVRQDVTTDDAGEPILAAPSWQGTRGQTLRDVLKNWSDVAGVELYWSIDYDYRLTEDIGYPGTYDEAVAKVLDRFSAVRPQPYGQLHQNNEGPRVLVVKSYDLIQ